MVLLYSLLASLVVFVSRVWHVDSTLSFSALSVQYNKGNQRSVGVAIDNDTLYAVGGRLGDTTSAVPSVNSITLDNLLNGVSTWDVYTWQDDTTTGTTYSYSWFSVTGVTLNTNNNQIYFTSEQTDKLFVYDTINKTQKEFNTYNFSQIYNNTDANCGVNNNTHIFLVGGRLYNSGTNIRLRTLQIYDIEKDAWYYGSDMHKNRSFFACEYDETNNYIWAVAGRTLPGTGSSIQRTNTVEYYDITTDVWTLLDTTLYKKRSLHFSVLWTMPNDNIMNGLTDNWNEYPRYNTQWLYVFGGTDDTSYLTATDVISIGSNDNTSKVLDYATYGAPNDLPTTLTLVFARWLPSDYDTIDVTSNQINDSHFEETVSIEKQFITVGGITGGPAWIDDIYLGKIVYDETVILALPTQAPFSMPSSDPTAPTATPTNMPTDVPSPKPKIYSNQTLNNTEGCENIDGSGWLLVRHVSDSYGKMHPATDNAAGSDIYGTYDGDAQSGDNWSIRYNNVTFNQFLFATGDCTKWLVVTYTELLGSWYYSNTDRCILNSSEGYSLPYYAKWYYRSSFPEDPWVSTIDHADAQSTSCECMVYGENSSDAWPVVSVTNRKGLNVWIRNKADETRFCGMTGTPTNEPSKLPSDVPSDKPSSNPTTSKPSLTPSYAPSNVPSLNPSMVPTAMPSIHPKIYSNQTLNNTDGCENIDGGGWLLVRHVSDSYGKMHPATDNAAGSDIYGTYDGDAQSGDNWSIRYNNVTFNQFLFATGDCTKWLVVTYTELLGSGYYTNTDRCILNSSEGYSLPYYALWYYRSSFDADPWVSTIDHASSTSCECMVYGEDSYDGWPDASVTNRKGLNVWIRNKIDETRFCGMTGTPTTQPTKSPSDPTKTPTFLPSVDPSNPPTDVPSNVPSAHPTIIGECYGCSGGGTDGGVDCYDVLNDGKIYGCRGTFSGGMYDASTSAICASGYHVCDSGTEVSNLGLVSGAGTCAAVIGTNEVYFTRETSAAGSGECDSVYGNSGSEKNDVWGCGGSSNLCGDFNSSSACLGLNSVCGDTNKYGNDGNLVYGGLSDSSYELMNISVLNDTFGGVLCCIDKCGGCNESNTDSGSINQINIDSNTDCYQLSNDSMTSSLGYDSTIYACRGAFTGPMNSSSAENICGDGYHMCVSANEVKSLGLVGDKCKSIIGDNEVFWTQETSDGFAQCNSKYGKSTSYRNDIWGCCGNSISKFTSCASNNNCYGLDATCTSASGNIYIDGELAMSLSSYAYYEWDHFVLYDGTYGGVLCCPDQPTSAPTYLPTEFPSVEPSNNPSKDPSANPSSNPSHVPSKNPSDVPSNNPSGNPTIHPSNIPSMMPTAYPTKIPSQQPTGQPVTPTNIPTDVPSSNPTTANPTLIPTSSPIVNIYSNDGGVPSLNLSQCDIDYNWYPSQLVGVEIYNNTLYAFGGITANISDCVTRINWIDIDILLYSDANSTDDWSYYEWNDDNSTGIEYTWSQFKVYGSTIVDGLIYMVGIEYSQMLIFDAINKIQIPLSDYFFSKTEKRSCGVNNGSHVFAVAGTYSDTLEIYDITNDVWTVGGNLNLPRLLPTCFYDETNDKIWVVGGGISAGVQTNTFEYYDINQDKWYLLSNTMNYEHTAHFGVLWTFPSINNNLGSIDLFPRIHEQFIYVLGPAQYTDIINIASDFIESSYALNYTLYGEPNELPYQLQRTHARWLPSDEYDIVTISHFTINETHYHQNLFIEKTFMAVAGIISGSETNDIYIGRLTYNESIIVDNSSNVSAWYPTVIPTDRPTTTEPSLVPSLYPTDSPIYSSSTTSTTSNDFGEIEYESCECIDGCYNGDNNEFNPGYKTVFYAQIGVSDIDSENTYDFEVKWTVYEYNNENDTFEHYFDSSNSNNYYYQACDSLVYTTVSENGDDGDNKYDYLVESYFELYYSKWTNDDIFNSDICDNYDTTVFKPNRQYRFENTVTISSSSSSSASSSDSSNSIDTITNQAPNVSEIIVECSTSPENGIFLLDRYEVKCIFNNLEDSDTSYYVNYLLDDDSMLLDSYVELNNNDDDNNNSNNISVEIPATVSVGNHSISVVIIDDTSLGNCYEDENSLTFVVEYSAQQSVIINGNNNNNNNASVTAFYQWYINYLLNVTRYETIGEICLLYESCYGIFEDYVNDNDVSDEDYKILTQLHSLMIESFVNYTKELILSSHHGGVVRGNTLTMLLNTIVTITQLPDALNEAAASSMSSSASSSSSSSSLLSYDVDALFGCLQWIENMLSYNMTLGDGVNVIESIDNLIELLRYAYVNIYDSSSHVTTNDDIGDLIISIMIQLGNILLDGAIVGEYFEFNGELYDISIHVKFAKISESVYDECQIDDNLKVSNELLSVKSDNGEYNMNCIIMNTNDNLYNISEIYYNYNKFDDTWVTHFTLFELISDGDSGNNNNMSDSDSDDAIYLSSCEPIILSYNKSKTDESWWNDRYPLCSYYNETTESYKTDGCYVIYNQDNNIQCACLHLTFFATSWDVLYPEINYEPISIVQELTIETLINYPLGWLIALLWCLIMGLLIWFCDKLEKDHSEPNEVMLQCSQSIKLIKKDDNPLVVTKMMQERGTRYNVSNNEYRSVKEYRIKSNAELTFWQKVFGLWKINECNDHVYLGLCFRDHGTHFTTRQRLCVLMVRLLTTMAVSSLFYGIERNSMIGDWILVFWESLFGYVPIYMVNTMRKPNDEEMVKASGSVCDNTRDAIDNGNGNGNGNKRGRFKSEENAEEVFAIITTEDTTKETTSIGPNTQDGSEAGEAREAASSSAARPTAAPARSKGAENVDNDESIVETRNIIIENTYYSSMSYIRNVNWFIGSIALFSIVYVIITTIWCIYLDASLSFGNEYQSIIDESECIDSNYIDVSALTWLNYNLTQEYIDNELNGKYNDWYSYYDDDVNGMTLSARFCLGIFLCHLVAIAFWQPLMEILFVVYSLSDFNKNPNRMTEGKYFSENENFGATISGNVIELQQQTKM